MRSFAERSLQQLFIVQQGRLAKEGSPVPMPVVTPLGSNSLLKASVAVRPDRLEILHPLWRPKLLSGASYILPIIISILRLALGSSGPSPGYVYREKLKAGGVPVSSR